MVDYNNVIHELMRDYGMSQRAAEQIVYDTMSEELNQQRLAERIENVKSMSYRQWLKIVSPELNWDYKHVILISDLLDAVRRGELTKLMIFIQPRIGKSELVTKRFPVCWIEQNPSDRIIVGSYNSDLAEYFAKESLQIYKRRFPEDFVRQSEFTPKDPKEAASEWNTINGGGVKGVGVSKGVTGRGAECILIDDPIKNFTESVSITYQEQTINWYSNDLYTRRNNGTTTPVIITNTRWNTMDLCGRILNSPDGKNWHVLSLPALAKHNDPLGRRLGEPLVPERFSKEFLESLRDNPDVIFNALYQQEPVDESRRMFETEKAIYVDNVPRNAIRVRFWDKAATASAGDWTVGLLMALDENQDVFIEDIVRGQWGPDGVEKAMTETCEIDFSMYGGSDKFSYTVVVEEEPSSGGKIASHYLGKALMRFPVEFQKPDENKTARARPYGSALNRGLVKIKRAPWNAAYIAELKAFVEGASRQQDDQVDASSGAYARLVIEFVDVQIRK